ncbi:MAG: hypothetical protein Q9219_003733 [cf. Caloplaca sp. 3 TL-2023]
MDSSAINLPAFAATQLSLLASELAAETSQNSLLLSAHPPRTLSRVGLAITNLVLSSQRTGLGGKIILELEQDNAIGSEELGDHGIRVGDIIRVGQQPKGGEKKLEKKSMELKGLEGVVVKLSRKTVQIALDKDEEETDGMGSRLWV